MIELIRRCIDLCVQMRWRLIPHIRMVRQPGPVSCGAASLAMVMQGFGKPIAVQMIRQHLIEGPRGTLAEDLMRVAETYGWSSHDLVETLPQ